LKQLKSHLPSLFLMLEGEFRLSVPSKGSDPSVRQKSEGSVRKKRLVSCVFYLFRNLLTKASLGESGSNDRLDVSSLACYLVL
jgi:hypothetical protein